MESVLTPRWTPLIAHPEQVKLMQSSARFIVVPAGRRSGKTERAKRKLVRTALMAASKFADPRYFAAAPTRDQAKRLYWDDLKKMIPRDFMMERPRESELLIKLVNGASIQVIGMDKPERIEGSPWDGGILDEFANMKKKAWEENVMPALADRRGWCWLIGVPEGRNHYYDIYQEAVEDTSGLMAGFTWKSADILPPEELALYKSKMDELTFQQEFEASFVNFQGRVYYPFDRSIHCSNKIEYNPALPLILCFDFNVSPGVCAICQEFPELPNGVPGTGVVDEVYIPRNSNTQAVCRKILSTYGTKHKGLVYCYGDATGGNAGSAKLMGSDWDIIRRELRPAWPENLRIMVPSSNGPERSRVNAVNTRLLTVGVARLMINGSKAPNLVKDFEGVKCLEGGSGEIDKDDDETLTHISDAIGYYIVQKFPIVTSVGQREF